MTTILILVWLISLVTYHHHHYNNYVEDQEFVEEMLEVLTSCASIPPEVAPNKSCQAEPLEKYIYLYLSNTEYLILSTDYQIVLVRALSAGRGWRDQGSWC